MTSFPRIYLRAHWFIKKYLAEDARARLSKNKLEKKHTSESSLSN